MVKMFLAGLLSLATLLPAFADGANYDESKVPAYTLPDPLVFDNGKPVRKARQWKKRRAELLETFRAEMFGREPAAPRLRYELLKVVPDALGGLATMKEVKVLLEPSGEHYMVLLLFVPHAGKSPAPAFLGLNFCNNHGTTSLEEVSLPDSLQVLHYGPYYKRMERGEQTRRWPYEYILSQGYACYTVFMDDIEPDERDSYDFGIRTVYDQGKPRADSWGAVSAWAWGLSRALDYLAADPDVDAARVAVHGHSRLGKTALWAGAVDERFALVIANDSGCSGAALSRRAFGETLSRLNRVFPYWFCDNYKRYSDNEASLPFDQHELIALIAPRPVYVASASEDLWADPYGEYLSLVHATPVYRLLGYDGFSSLEMPEIEVPKVQGRMGHHIRNGKHDMQLYDWQQYVAFANRFL